MMSLLLVFIPVAVIVLLSLILARIKYVKSTLSHQQKINNITQCVLLNRLQINKRQAYLDSYNLNTHNLKEVLVPQPFVFCSYQYAQLMKTIVSIFILLSFSCQLSGYAQVVREDIANLKTDLSQAPKDTTRVNLLNKITSHYNVIALDSAKAFAVEGLQLADRLNYSQGQWELRNVLGNYYERKTAYDSALVYYNEALKIIDSLNSVKGRAVVLNNKANVFIRQGNYNTALELMFAALEAEQTLENQNGIAQAYNNIGVIYYYSQNFDKATTYLVKGLEVQESLGNLDGLINGYNNVGAIKDYQQKYHEAIESYQKALRISQSIGDIKEEASQLSNIALAQIKLNKLQEAENTIKTAISLREKAGDQNGKAQSFITFARVLEAQNKYDLANEYLTKGLNTAKEHHILLLQREALSGLASVASSTNKFKLANTYLEQLVAVKDSIVNKDNATAMAEMEAKYQTQQKENQILKQRAQLAEATLANKKKTTLFYSALGLAIVLGLIGYLVYSQQRLKNRQLQKEAQLTAALAKIETQNKLQEQRLRISRDLHDNIGAQLTFIISSLDNLKYGFKDIKLELLERLNGISRFTGQTIYELRDTIWAMNKEQIQFDDLKARITNFIDSAKSATDQVRFSFTVDKQVPDNYAFSSVAGMNIYRIIQEGVNNSLKYANATKISVHFAQDNSGFKLNIEDDGIGFNMNKTELGNGINNIKKRCRELGGEVQFISNKETGTSIRVAIPKNTQT